MAQWQARNTPTLVAGQTIAVNKYTVQVERYLSQGGFAHVYLVRTATPVYGTTHHVLKRIAVPDEVMLTEVKKEVDIMRILKGHPNIVHLIDAASHRLANGTYEVFILMEFCSGGGIIDMMNRRLRERLTEAEILTIFVDVCEGLAAMHALKPPLLHRDLKVENILQSSATSYKLCDFGSATAVHKVPSTGEELRALQTDIDRHTTMQYRAPEMVNLLQRRPIDEKSDVWALGVLLYKLCYYTTPFEERGPLAIQNVNYTIPPYPVYSHNMISLIGSMLREYGQQRPTVFELLNHVHALRGTRSRFTYNIPPKQPPVSPRAVHPQNLSSNVASPGAHAANPLDDLVLFKSRTSTSPSKNAGIQARDKVLEAIAPMRRGRPQAASPAAPTPSASPSKDHRNLGADLKFDPADDQAWRGVRGHKSGMASIGGGKAVNINSSSDPWALDAKNANRDANNRPKAVESNGFENNFTASPALGFGDAFVPPQRPTPQTASPRAQPIPISRPTPSPTPSGSVTRTRALPRDAFEGLGLSSQPPPQTLGDARRARTGIVSSNLTAGNSLAPPGVGSSTTTYRPPSAHVPSPAPIPQSQSPSSSPAFHPSSWQGPSKVPRRPVELSAEERFPSLEELDRTFTPESPEKPERVAAVPHAPTQPPSTERLAVKPAAVHARPLPSTTGGGPSAARTGNVLGSPAHGSGEAQLTRHNSLAAGRFDGIRSQQVTGTAMRESRLGHGRNLSSAAPQPLQPKPKPNNDSKPTPIASRHSRPVQPRRHRSSMTMKATMPIGESAGLAVPSSSSPARPALPPRPSPKPEQRDWLTGASDDEASASASQPVLRDSPSKRASYIERSPIQLEKPLEAVSGEFAPSDDLFAPLDRKRGPKDEPSRERNSPLGPREPDRRTQQEKHERVRAAEVGLASRTKSKDRNGGRRSPTKPVRSFSRKGAGPPSGAVPGGLKLPGMEPRVNTLAQSASPSGLTDNWSPIASPTRDHGSSSSDEGPEDLSGYIPDDSTGKHGQVSNQAGAENKAPRHGRSGSKGRQSSVHDLVDLWGGSQPPKSPSKIVDKRRSAIVTSPSMKQSLPGLGDRLRSSSPQPMIDVAPYNEPRPSTPTRASRPPSRQQQRQPAPQTVESSSKIAPVSSSTSLSSPTPSTSNASNRTRPQSMFLNPVAKTAALETSLSSSTNSAIKQAGQGSEEKPRRSGRRTSISDMVQRYESFGGPSKSGSKPPPPISTKPPVLGKTTSEASSAGLPSPSSAATRFPQISLDPEPVQSKSHLGLPDTSEPKEEASRYRRSPSPGMPSRFYAPPAKPAVNLTGAGKTISEMRQQQEFAASRPQESTSVPQAQTRRQETLSVPSPPEDLRSPSPEKPYKGVSKLIDRWQRVVDQNEGPDLSPKRGPNSSLRGR